MHFLKSLFLLPPLPPPPVATEKLSWPRLAPEVDHSLRTLSYPSLCCAWSIKVGCEWGPKSWRFSMQWYRSMSRKEAPLGTSAYLQSASFIITFQEIKEKRNSCYFLPFSFTLKSKRGPGELSTPQWWRQNDSQLIFYYSDQNKGVQL